MSKTITKRAAVTALNLSTLADYVAAHGETFEAAVPAVYARHLARCVGAGLLTVEAGIATLTDAGREAIAPFASRPAPIKATCSATVADPGAATRGLKF